VCHVAMQVMEREQRRGLGKIIAFQQEGREPRRCFVLDDEASSEIHVPVPIFCRRRNKLGAKGVGRYESSCWSVGYETTPVHPEG